MLDWVKVECPDCGRIGYRAAAENTPTVTPRYVLCPFCEPGRKSPAP
jgi:hypothetical protein